MKARAFLLSMLVLSAVPLAAATSGAGGDEAFRLGERMYRQGILPSGEPMQAVVKGDVAVEGTMFTCVSCHLRGGVGSFEGGVVTLPTNGRNLFSPRHDRYGISGEEGLKFVLKPRPAYTNETLATVLRDGFDPTEREMAVAMPRYLLGDSEMAILIAYLKSLSSEYSPGVSDNLIRFATVVTDDVSREDRAAMLAPLKAFVGMNNGAKRKYKGVGGGKDPAYRQVALDIWEITGPPDGWRAQLEAYSRKEPVFALLGGITGGDWRPIHDFSEANRIPCLFPVTDFPVVSDNDWYTLYFSKGFYQEGDAVARHLGGLGDGASEETVVQLFLDGGAGKALAAGFRDAWLEQGRRAPVEKMVRPGESLTHGEIAGLAGGKPFTLLLWLDDAAIPLLERMTDDPVRPSAVYVSSGMLKASLGSLPVKVRGATFVTWPWRLPQVGKGAAGAALAWLKAARMPTDRKRIVTRMYALTRLLSDAQMMLRENFYRDNFLDVVSNEEDKADYPDYERLSFGPGQRYASKGCYIVQLSPDAAPTLIPRSGWVTH